MLFISPASSQNKNGIKPRSKLGQLCHKHSIYLRRMLALTFSIGEIEDNDPG